MKTISKVFILLLISGSVLAKAKDPVLMQINGKPVYKSEFEYIYNKNNSNNALDKKSLEEYVDLFINFKLKVEEAKAQGIDTTKSFINELDGYRNQLTKPYLTDKTAEEQTVIDAYNRLKEEIEVSHILVRVQPESSPEDTLKAWNKILEIEKRIQTEDFSKVAKETSEDQSVTDNGGYIGWITGFRTVYPFETMAYQTTPGTISKPVRTAFGYHLIKVHNRRNSVGEILTAHIMKFTAQGEDEKNKIAKNQIDSIYQLLKNGADFGELASKESNDQGSAVNKGELPWFGIGRMVQEFEKAAFALRNKGDISEPVQSAYGWHIIKLIDTKPLASFEAKKEEIERQVKRDDRANVGQDAFVAKLKKDYKLKIAKPAALDVYYKSLNGKTLNDSAFLAQLPVSKKSVFKFAGKNYTQSDFSAYLKKNAFSDKVVANDMINEKLKEFIDKELLAYENSQLENKYNDFRLLMQEYHDGILLFEVSNNEVWEKASKDTAGLAEYFKRNADKYVWDKPHYKGRVIHCKDEKIMKAAKEILATQAKDSIDKKLKMLNDSIVRVKTDKGLFVKGDNKIIDKEIFGVTSALQKDNDYPCYFVDGKLLGLKPEEYLDVRGLVTADYQEYLEKEWIQKLRSKFAVKIDQKVLSTVKKN
jgi:peptidyl-prolyl cis-trans isomerase SurA